MKYIDADRLKAEIKKKQNEIVAEALNPDASLVRLASAKYKKDALSDAISIIDSLQQEQPEAELGADIKMEWDSFNKNVAEYGGESEDVVWLNWFSFTDIATYFYNLGLNARKEVRYEYRRT